MNPHPRRTPWPLLLATLFGLVILLSLGVWQVERLQWKQGLLAELAAKATAEPVDLATAEAVAKTGNAEFLKVRFRAIYKHDAGMKMISTFEGSQGWTIITPALSAEGFAVIVDRGRVPGVGLESFDQPVGEVEITGVLRAHGHGRGAFDPDNDPKARLWYWWDVPAMLQSTDLPAAAKPLAFAVQVLPGTVAAEFPKPQEPKANLTNNHLGYAITWFGLAIALAVVSLLYLRTLKNNTGGPPPAAA